MKFWGLFFNPKHYPPIKQQAMKGFIYFITLQLIWSEHFIAEKKRKNLLLAILVTWQVISNKCTSIGFQIFQHVILLQIGWRISNRTGYISWYRSSDLYHVMCFVQRAHAEINQWVINMYIFLEFSLYLITKDYIANPAALVFWINKPVLNHYVLQWSLSKTDTVRTDSSCLS